MQNNRWDEIESARQLLGLSNEVTRNEIQEAYRAKSRELHPDRSHDQTSNDMIRLNKAYRLLMEYADSYKIKLYPTEEGMTDEEWWMCRFGHDPIWVGDSKEK
ncbi:MAG: J domain-containing protein [Dissulfurimicrobium sp.]|uniref:J domain-containing protein n=1 Tax=Dissulfurimicrobium sp. TaxID=2022436 RepID=UPI0040491DF7